MDERRKAQCLRALGSITFKRSASIDCRVCNMSPALKSKAARQFGQFCADHQPRQSQAALPRDLVLGHTAKLHAHPPPEIASRMRQDVNTARAVTS